ncbi:MAG: hypothetical protein IIC01_11110 [Planctomycetes bacterium]|nr:hypothetical protein [Planctomycetota bacterium]
MEAVPEPSLYPVRRNRPGETGFSRSTLQMHTTSFSDDLMRRLRANLHHAKQRESLLYLVVDHHTK